MSQPRGTVRSQKLEDMEGLGAAKKGVDGFLCCWGKSDNGRKIPILAASAGKTVMKENIAYFTNAEFLFTVGSVVPTSGV